MATFPIITWKVQLDGSIRVSHAGNTPSALDVDVTTTGDGVWGYATETDGTASTDSLAYHLMTEIADAVTEYTAAPSATIYEVDTTTTHPRYRLAFTDAGADAASISEGNTGPIALTDIGIDTSVSRVISSGQHRFTSEMNCAGWWQAAIELTKQFREDQHFYEHYGSVYDTSVDATMHFGNRTSLRLMWEQVEDAYVYGHRAADSAYAALAGRSADDPNCLIDGEGGLLTEYCLGDVASSFRVYFGPGDYITVRKDDQRRGIARVTDWVTEYPDDPRRSTVTLKGFKIVTT